MSSRFHAVESLNARNMSPKEIADTFVAHDGFAQLWQNNNVVLMGPRGSGKTTMLKMLTAPALHAWRDEQAIVVRQNMLARAVYIPSDIHWHHQLVHSKAQLVDRPQVADVFSQVAVTTNVLMAVCETIADLLHLRQGNNTKLEADLADVVIRECRLQPTALAFPAIQHRLRSRISDLHIWANKMAADQHGSDSLALPESYYLDYLAAAGNICATYDDLASPGDQRRWALCFDELELAPEWLQQRLFAELRNANQAFLFKLSTSPIPTAVEFTDATWGNDFTVVRLWPTPNGGSAKFCERLTRGMLRRRKLSKLTPDSLFGSSRAFAASENEYERESATWRVFKEWAEMDTQFRQTLEKHDIDPNDPSTDDVTKRDQVLRKAKPLVYLRRELLKKTRDGKLTLRGRRVLPIYSGAQAIYDVSDANPRWLTAIVNELLEGQEKEDRTRRIAPETQAAVLQDVSHHFGAMLQALPNSAVAIDGRSITLFEFLTTLGEYFFRSMVLDDFSLDPPGSFFVDEKVPAQIHALIREAVYQGALIVVESDIKGISADLVGRRLRLAYLLAPSFKLPPRLFKAVALSRCLADSKGGAGKELQHSLPLASV